MRRLNFFNRMVICVFLLLGLGVNSGSAAIYVAGDANITDPLVGAQGAIIDTGNQQFFSNILQGGNSVGVLTGLGSWEPWGSVNTYYNSIPGVSSSLISGSVDSNLLGGLDLFIAVLANDLFSNDEIAALDIFLAGGGSIFFIGEHSGFFENNQIINHALSGLNSGMSIMSNSTFDATVWNTATGSQIANDPINLGVNSFTYNTPSQMEGGTPLFLGTGGQVFVAYETAVPIPAAVWLLSSGLVGLVGLRKRMKK